MKTIVLGLLATFALAAPAVVNAQVVTYNANPTGGFQYGSGNNYTPANATVLTNGNNELAVQRSIANSPIWGSATSPDF